MDAMVRALLSEFGVDGEVKGGAGFAFDLENLLAKQKAIDPLEINPDAGGGGFDAGDITTQISVDAKDAEAILWIVQLKDPAVGLADLKLIINDADESAFNVTNGAALDVTGNAITKTYAGDVHATTLFYLVERGNRELHANANSRPSKRYRQIDLASSANSNGDYLLSAVALVLRRRLPPAADQTEAN